ncbi:MAG: hypothetical protein AVDCRST_MAG49-962, partial [uncultured Thermomicrobiales bacterium]
CVGRGPGLAGSTRSSACGPTAASRRTDRRRERARSPRSDLEEVLDWARAAMPTDANAAANRRRLEVDGWPQGFAVLIRSWGRPRAERTPG